MFLQCTQFVETIHCNFYIFDQTSMYQKITKKSSLTKMVFIIVMFIFTIDLSPCTQSAERTLFRKPVVAQMCVKCLSQIYSQIKNRLLFGSLLNVNKLQMEFKSMIKKCRGIEQGQTYKLQFSSRLENVKRNTSSCCRFVRVVL